MAEAFWRHLQSLLDLAGGPLAAAAFRVHWISAAVKGTPRSR